MGDDWQVLLLGGTAGAGKTTTAAALAVHFGCSWLQADSLWVTLRTIVPRSDLPEMHLFRDPGTLTPDVLVTRLKESAAIICRALERVIPFELEARGRFILEGSWLLPSFASRVEFGGTNVESRVAYIHEPEPAEVLRAMKTRSADPNVITADQAVIAQGCALFGDWLKDEAAARALPVVAARPRATLATRVLEAVGGGSGSV